MTKEGLYFTLPFLILAAALFYLFHRTMSVALLYACMVSFYLGLIFALFFRDPERKVPEGEKLILAPADGKIIRLENEDDGISLSIFLSIYNVHVNRSPIRGEIRSLEFKPGRFRAAFRPEARHQNQRNEIEIEVDRVVVKMNQVSGAIARRAICYKKPGDHVDAGERIGLIRFGSRVDLLLPRGCTIDVIPGQRILAGETIIGRMP
jgi:phosphatidylserine decarboxylase